MPALLLNPASPGFVSNNGSSKSYYVPLAQTSQIVAVHAVLVSSATAGNRQLAVNISDNAGNYYARVVCGATQAASLTYRYTFATGMPDLTSARATNYVLTPLCPIFLNSTIIINVVDTAAVDTVGDSLTVTVSLTY